MYCQLSIRERDIFFMNNLPDELRNEYEYISSKAPDIEEITYPLINVSDTLRAYFILAHYFTDDSSGDKESMLIGVRDIGLLSSAIGRQLISYNGKRKYTDKIDICATLFYGLVKNHSFSDGNKRTALLILLYQLSLYGYIPNAPKKSFEKLVVSVAANNIKKDYIYEYKKCLKEDDPIVATISRVIRKSVKKKDHSYHINPTMREVCDALSPHGVTYNLRGNKLHMERKTTTGFLKRAITYQYTASFSGWTRTVGADTARKILTNLKLYDEFANYKDFIEGKEAMYQLVDDFSGPLRRLKDK